MPYAGNLSGLDVVDGGLARAAIFLGVEGNLLTLVEAADAGAFQRGRVDEHVLAAIVRLNEAEAFLTVVELYGAGFHKKIPFTGVGAHEPETAQRAN